MARKPAKAKGSRARFAAAAKVGDDLAGQVLKHRATAAGKRAKAIAKVSAAPGAPAASAGVVIAEGDSWFDYPFNDILKDLEDNHGYDVEAVAHKGDRLEDMAYSGGQLDDFTRRIEKVLRNGAVPKAILISGGGNDIAGPELAIMLNHAMSSIAGLNEQVVAGVIDTRLAEAYVTMLTAVTRICEAKAGRKIRILLHGYDRPVPDGRGVLGGAWILPGPWLEPSFRQKGYAAMPQRITLIGGLIDRFNAMLASMTRRPGFEHVGYIDLRASLSSGSDYRKWWANELHPTERGFAAVSAKVAAAIG